MHWDHRGVMTVYICLLLTANAHCMFCSLISSTDVIVNLDLQDQLIPPSVKQLWNTNANKRFRDIQNQIRLRAICL